ncbi:unnamed protein product, partial [Urochloa humidicola]
MDGGRRGGWGLRRREGQQRSGRRIPAGRRGFWISLHGRNRGAVVEEGVDFAQDSEEGGAGDFLFLSDSEEEGSDDFNDRSLVTHSEDLGVGDARTPASPVIDESRRMEAVGWQDIAGHSQLPEEEADEEQTEQQ